MLKKSEWGPRLWRFLHALSFAFPEKPTPEQVDAFHKLLDALKVLIPCPECRNHYCEYLGGSPAPTNCGQNLREWLVNFHNDVNVRLGKPVVSLAEAEKLYDATGDCGWGGMAFWFTIVIVFVGVALLCFLWGTRHKPRTTRA